MLKKKGLYLAAAMLFMFATNSPPTGAHAETTGGTVLETMNGAGYTYLYIDSGSAKEWVAVPETKVAIGDHVSYTPGMEMKDFHSKTLDRSFASIIFSAGLTGGGQAAAPPAATPPAAADSADDNSFAAAVAAEQQAKATAAPADMAGASGGSAGAVVPFTEAAVAKAPGENSYTVGELFSRTSELNGQTVRLRGKVVKFSANIMGKNWVHLQDGSGNPMNNTHDLVVTTSEMVAKGDIVVFEGKLAADKDFGAGYSYTAILEEAKIIK